MHDSFSIPVSPETDPAAAAEAMAKKLAAWFAQRSTVGVEKQSVQTPKFLKGVADIATNLWRAKVKMVDGSSGEVRDEMKRVYRHIASALDALDQLGFELKDHTGDAFDYGLPLKVITSQPTVGISRETVIETLKPTIRWEKQIIQMGEVVIGTPSSPDLTT